MLFPARTEARPDAQPDDKGFLHEALIYHSERDFLDAALPYVRDGIWASEPVLVRVRGANTGALREALGAEAEAADLEPAEGWYETPARTRKKFADWVAEHSDGRRVRLMGEPPWPLASEAGIREWARHESVLNLAFAGSPVTFACPYDAGTLPPSIIEHAKSTHPEIRRAGGVVGSESYTDPRAFCARLNGNHARSGSPAVELGFGADELGDVRRLVEREAMSAGIPEERIEGLLSAVNEVAANALVHGAQPVRIRIWRDPGGLACEVTDAGPGISDPLAGQLQPDLGTPGGLGLWMARMTSDAIEIGRDSAGTVVAVHVLHPRS